MTPVAQSRFVRGLERRYEAIVAAERVAGASDGDAHGRAFQAVKVLGVRALVVLRDKCTKGAPPNEADVEA